MAHDDGNERKCFAFIWKLENASYCVQQICDLVSSPAFVVDEIDGTKWKLELYPRSASIGNISLYLRRADKGIDIVIDCELAFLALDGTVLRSWKSLKNYIPTGRVIGPFPFFIARAKVFGERRLEFVPCDTLTARCKIWKSDAEISQDIQCFTRTRLAFETRSYVFNIGHFGTQELNQKHTHQVKSVETGELLMSLELIVNGAPPRDKTISFVATRSGSEIIFCNFKFFLVDGSESTEVDEVWFRFASVERKEYILRPTNKELIEKKSAYLMRDTLCLRCECLLSDGSLIHEKYRLNFDCTPLDNGVSEKSCASFDNTSLPSTSGVSEKSCASFDNTSLQSINVLKDDLVSILNESIHSDVELRVNSKTYPAHKCILSGRSPVFKAMFSNDMKEKMTDCVNIKDISEDGIFHMLRYIYCAEVGQLEWSSATELYEASDKYQILTLKDIVSSYLKAHLCAKNACEALLLADLHQDEGLKSFAQSFILRNGKDIASEEWKNLMKTNLQLATEIMCLKFKE